MRACFLGQNVCALGNGIAVLHIPALPSESEPNVIEQNSGAKGFPRKPVRRPAKTAS
jgi:hypothetical protein